MDALSQIATKRAYIGSIFGFYANNLVFSKIKQPMITAAIIDDEYDARQALIKLIGLTFPMVEIIGEAEGVQSGVQLLNSTRPNIVFLDIQMRDGTGFDLLDYLSEPDFHLIFTTAYSEFALKAFEYSAVDYLVKPIDPKELIRSIKKANLAPVDKQLNKKMALLIEQFKAKKSEKVVLSTQEGLVFLALKDIVRLESEGSYTSFYTVDEKRIVVTKSLKAFERILPDNRFLRPHQSHIINLDFISKVLKEDGSYILMRDGKQIPISRRRKDTFYDQISRHLFS